LDSSSLFAQFHLIIHLDFNFSPIALSVAQLENFSCLAPFQEFTLNFRAICSDPLIRLFTSSSFHSSFQALYAKDFSIHVVLKEAPEPRLKG